MLQPFPKAAVSFLLLVLLAGCQKVSPAEDPTPTPVVRLPIVQVQRQNLSNIVTLTGTVNALPDHSVKVSPAVAGKLIAVLVVPGQRIYRGQLIARLDNRQVKDQIAQADAVLQGSISAVAQAQTNLTLARNTLARVQMLYNEKIAPQKDLIAAQSQVATSQEQVRSAKAQVAQARASRAQVATQLGFAELRSPISGVVARRLLNAGDTVDPVTPVLQVVDLETVVINASLPADSSAPIRIQQSARVRSAAQPGVSFPATVTAISPVVDLQSNTLAVQMRCANRQGELKEGQSVTVQITTGMHRGALTVPKTALVPDPEKPGQRLVYRFRSGKISRVPVQTGIEEGGRIEITSGLSSGEEVAASGAYGLPDGTTVEAIR
ncbi:MAG: efflux RND transporter periplasmic adaptor subunit [Kovacikia sp.]